MSLTFPLSKDVKMKAVQFLEEVKTQLPPKFTFSELLKIAVDNQCVINLEDFIDDTFGFSLYIRVYLDYTYGEYVGNRVLFHKLDYEVEEKSYGLDEKEAGNETVI